MNEMTVALVIRPVNSLGFFFLILIVILLIKWCYIRASMKSLLSVLMKLLPAQHNLLQLPRFDLNKTFIIITAATTTSDK